MKIINLYYGKGECVPNCVSIHLVDVEIQYPWIGFNCGKRSLGIIFWEYQNIGSKIHEKRLSNNGNMLLCMKCCCSLEPMCFSLYTVTIIDSIINYNYNFWAMKFKTKCKLSNPAQCTSFPFSVYY